MADATDINSLPTVQENVSLEITQPDYNPNVNQQNANQQNISNSNASGGGGIPQVASSLSNTAIQQIVDGIQRASDKQLTDLPMRDIPTTTQHINSDIQTTPDYIPTNPNQPVETDHEIYNELIRRKQQKLQETDTLDSLYNDLQLPILAGILYFVFQLPFFQDLFFKYAPFLFLKDGNPGIGIYVTKMLLFSTSIFILTKVIKYLSKL